MSGTLADWERERFSTKTADEIDALPETPEPAHTAPAEDPLVRAVLLERSYAGLRVEIVYLHGDSIALRVTKGEDKSVLQPIPGEAAFDAFHHPYCYLPA